MTLTMPRTRQATDEQEPVLRADRRGYVLGDDSVDGFADQPDLSTEARQKLARWARRFSPDELSDDQATLLEVADHQDTSGERDLLRAALLDAERDVDATYALGLYQELSDEQLQLVRNPARHPALESRDYPLSMTEMEVLTGATQRQLRYWDRLGLLPTYRINNRRVFLGSAVARAFALKEAKQHEVAAMAALARGGPEAARFVRMLGSVLGSVARRVQEPAARELGRAADLLVTSSGILIRGQRDATAPTSGVPDGAGVSDSEPAQRKRGQGSARGGTTDSRRVAARHVVPRRAAKGWAVVASPDSRPSSTYQRKADAVKAARVLVAKRGGGKVVIHEKSGETIERRVSSATRGRAAPAGTKRGGQRALEARSRSRASSRRRSNA